MKAINYWVLTTAWAISIAFPSTGNAALVSRLGGLAYYDTATDLTWLADANAAVGSAYDTYAPGTGLMDWSTANAWAASLNIDGVTGWRLPDTNPINGSSYDYTYAYDGSTDFGYNISAPGTAYAGSTESEMAYLFYNTLGDKGFEDTTGTPQSGSGLSNTGPFSGVRSDYYWSATEDAQYTYNAWDFFMSDGLQADGNKGNDNYAWAVHSGDVDASVVPVPAAVWLFGSGLLALVGVSRKRRR